MLYFSAIALGAGVLIAAYGGEVALGVGFSAVGVLGRYGAFNGINLSKAYKRNKGWSYRVDAKASLMAIPE